MKHGVKIKLAATALAAAGMFSGAVTALAQTLTGLGVKSVPNTDNYMLVVTSTKTTADRCSDITLADVTIYDSIQVRTTSQNASGKYVESNPWTNCLENSSTYLGQYVSMETYVSQQVRLYIKKSRVATQPYTVDIESWDYH